MPTIIRLSGFGILELLIVLVLVIVLAVTLMRSHKKATPTEVAALQSAMRTDLESSSNVTFKRLASDYIAGTNSEGDFEYVLSGYFPNQSWVRNGKDGSVVIENRVKSIRLSFLDENGQRIGEEPSSSQLKSVKKIAVEIQIHTEESSDYYVNDGFDGIDLDHDLTNGTAHLRKHTFGIVLK